MESSKEQLPSGCREMLSIPATALIMVMRHGGHSSSHENMVLPPQTPGFPTRQQEPQDHEHDQQDA